MAGDHKDLEIGKPFERVASRRFPLVDKAVDPKVTFATEREKIVDMLRKRKTDELHEATLGRMREKSKIVFSK
jgi:hypothetical protein